MFQYLLNTTAIWLLSLIMFDVLLRKETFHSYNRAYLLFTFLLGLLLPLWKWKADTAVRVPVSIATPMRQAAMAKQSIVQNTGAYTANVTVHIQHKLFNWEQLLSAVYIIGVAIAMVLFVIEIIKLLRLFSSGIKTKEGKWVIIETSRSHAPCSILNYIIVSSKQEYTMEEWDTIIKHEKGHGQLLHFADLLLMQLSKIVFWFHPLVYLYEKRLLLVHEYQTDRQLMTSPKMYGQFLVDQAMLRNGSSLSHSLTRSPIKKRILMLTKRSSQMKMMKLIVLIPVLLCSMVCFTRAGFSGSRQIKGTKVFYNGNVFEESFADTPIVFNGNFDTAVAQAQHFNRVIKMNEKPIYVYDRDDDYNAVKDKNATHAIVAKNTQQFYKLVTESTMTLLTQLDDGIYQLPIFNIVVDGNGELVYYEDRESFLLIEDTMMHSLGLPRNFPQEAGNEGIIWGEPISEAERSKDDYEVKIHPTLKVAIDKKIYALLDDMPIMEKVYEAGLPVSYSLGYQNFAFKIKNHHFYFIPLTSLNH